MSNEDKIVRLLEQISERQTRLEEYVRWLRGVFGTVPHLSGVIKESDEPSLGEATIEDVEGV